jgi:hypothetical protein
MARPLARVNQAILSHDVTLEVGNVMVLLDVVAFNDRALEVGSYVDQLGAIFTLRVARGVPAFVGARTPVSATSRNALPVSGGGTSTRELLDWVSQTVRRPSASSASGRKRPGRDGTPRRWREGCNWFRLSPIRSYRGNRTRLFSWGRESNVCVIRSRWDPREVMAITKVWCVGCV